MAEFEFEFNQQDTELVVSQGTGTFNSNADYIRLTIYPTEAINNIVDLPDDTKGVDGKAIFFSSNAVGPYQINIAPFLDSTNPSLEERTKQVGQDEGDFKIYKGGIASNPTYYIKPNEIFNDFELPQGDYKIQIDFLSQEQTNTSFTIKQVSTSRKEVRIKNIDGAIVEGSSIITGLTQAFNDGEDKYQFKHILNIGTGDHIPIMNYAFDKITDGKDNQSLILKLYDALPVNVGNLSQITIEKEVLTTQIQDIFYFSDVPDVFFGDGLPSDAQENWINPDGNDIQYQNYNELTGSIGNNAVDNLISQSFYDYPNLNTDYRFFKNHTFFGSAKKKLENFNTKIETIQSHYSEISSSLVVSSSINGDSTFIVQKRKNLFKKINDEIKTFSPYERFLYYDGQNESTASAPGLGKNYADSTPVNLLSDEGTQLNAFDGFDVVYKHTTTNMGDDTRVDVFNGKNLIQNKPLFNYSGSIYLSFLLKGDEFITSSIGGEFGGPGLRWPNVQTNTTQNGMLNDIKLPRSSLHRKLVQNPAITGSEYRRFIYEASMSYWAPTNVANGDGIPIDFDIQKITNFEASSTHYTILSNNPKTGSNPIKDSTGAYPTTVITQSGIRFTGSCMPAGDPFFVGWANVGSGKTTSSFITNVNVTLNNPNNVLPFDNVYKTTSTEWTSWYNGMIDSASAFDTDNIHSFENNLPLYIQGSSDYQDMKDFLSLQGEQYDLIRNHIDSLGTLHDRGYKKTNSPPENTLPMLLSNMGYQAINPFTGNLTETLGSYLTSVTSIDDIKNNTWRKTLNNLPYIYKSKGTKNSVRALLNVYGYPPDILEFQEFGGSTEESNPRIFVNNPPSGSGIDLSLDTSTGSFSFTSNKRKLPNYNFSSVNKRILNLDWWMDSANINTFEFIYKHNNTTNTQTILESSGSGALKAEASLQVLSGNPAHFDGTLLKISSSDGTGKTYVFDDDSDGATGTLDGSGRVRIQLNGITLRDEIANEISNSISSTNGHFGKITVVDSVQFVTNNGLNFVTNGGLNFFANSSGSITLTQSTGSVSGNNLVTTTAPSMSVSGFLGGSDNQSLWDLRLVPSSDGISSSFEFRLNNTPHASSSISSNAVSMSTDYSNISDGQLWNVMLQRMTSSTSTNIKNEYRLHSSLQEGKKIKTYNYVTMSLSGSGTAGDKNAIANKNWMSSGSRHALSSSNLFVGETHSGSLSEIRGWSTALSTSKFRQHTLNKFSTVGNTINSHKNDLVYHFKLNENYTSASISSSTQTMNIVDAAPTTTYSDYTFTKSGTTFNTSSVYGFDFIEVVKLSLQDNISKPNDNNILINPRKNIIGNLSPIQSAVIPLTQKNSKPLFKTSVKLELYRSPQTFVDNFILDKLSGYNLETLYGNPLNYYSQSYDEFDTFREEFFDANPITIDTNQFVRAHENMFNHSIIEGMKSIVPARSTFSGKNSNVGVEIRPTILEKQKYENEKQDIETNPNTITGSVNPVVSSPTSEYIQPKSGSISIISIESIMTGSSLVLPKSGSISLSPLTGGSSLVLPKSGSISPSPSYGGSTVVLPKTGSIDYASHANKSFVNIHNSWGTSSADTQFLNYAGGTGSYGTFNTYHIDTRFVFHAIGDNEYYSASNGAASNYTNSSRFYNRLYLTDGIHAQITYDSKNFGTGAGIVTGRMMGKTRYFSTGSDGNIILPANHVSRYIDHYITNMNNGTQNTNPGILNVQYEDYSTASFYRVTVTGGENQIIVKSGNPTIGSNNKIIYG